MSDRFRSRYFRPRDWRWWLALPVGLPVFIFMYAVTRPLIFAMWSIDQILGDDPEQQNDA